MKETAVRTILAPALKEKAVIGLAPLAGPYQDKDFQAGVKILTDLGFTVKTLNTTTPLPFLAGSDEERLAILHSLWRDPEVQAVMAIRGGYGTMRLLPGLDYDLLCQIPKPLIGFSDISALLNVISQRTGLITFHGPNLTTLSKSDKNSLEAFIQSLTRPAPPAIKDKGIEVLRGGRAEGMLMGGNLATLMHLAGTPFQANLQDKILFIEDVGEAPYRVDRLLTQLHLSGALSQTRGLILGEFSGCGDEEMIWHRALELLREIDIPIWGGFPVGHGSRNFCLPIGSEVVMDSDRAMLSWAAPCLTA